jgi:hypothetical protein
LPRSSKSKLDIKSNRSKSESKKRKYQTKSNEIEKIQVGCGAEEVEISAGYGQRLVAAVELELARLGSSATVKIIRVGTIIV